MADTFSCRTTASGMVILWRNIEIYLDSENDVLGIAPDPALAHLHTRVEVAIKDEEHHGPARFARNIIVHPPLFDEDFDDFEPASETEVEPE